MERILLFLWTSSPGPDASITAEDRRHSRLRRNLDCAIMIPRNHNQRTPTTLVWSMASVIPWRLRRTAQADLPRLPQPQAIHSLLASTGGGGPVALLLALHWPANHRHRGKHIRLILTVTYIKVTPAIILCILEAHYHNEKSARFLTRTIEYVY